MTAAAPASGVARVRRHRARRGATLVELLVGTALGLVVLAAELSVLVRLQRADGWLRRRAAARAQLAHAASVLGAELRAAQGDSTASDPADLLLLADSAVELRATIGSSVACAVAGGGTVVEVVDGASAAAAGAAGWTAAPREGDWLLVHDEGARPSAGDDAWRSAEVRGATSSASACRSGPAAPLADAGGHWRVTLSTPLPATIAAGAPVRALRRRRYALYRAGDGLWYLGQREWELGASTMQPVAGPLLPHRAGGGGGMHVVAVDADGAALVGAPAGRTVVRTVVTLRAGGTVRGVSWRDSAVVHVAARVEGR